MEAMPSAGPQITRDDVAHLAGLARIHLSDDELDRLAPELSKIVDAVAGAPRSPRGPSRICARVAGVSRALGGAGDVEPMSHPTPIRNVFRGDEVDSCL